MAAVPSSNLAVTESGASSTADQALAVLEADARLDRPVVQDPVQVAAADDLEWLHARQAGQPAGVPADRHDRAR